MIEEYIRNINRTVVELCPNYYLLTSERRAYVACIYKLRNSHKKKVVEITRRYYGIGDLREGEFSFHHIVDRPQLSDISVVGPRIDDEYDLMPSIMLHNKDHNYIHGKMSYIEYRKLSLRRDTDILKKAVASEEVSRKMYMNNPSDARKEVEKRIQIYKELYAEAFSSDYIIRNIALNIFDEYKRRLSLF